MNTPRLTTILLSAFGLLCLGDTKVFSAQNLIQNGSFEQPGASGNQGPGREEYDAGSTALTGWTLGGSGNVFLHKTPDMGNDTNQTYNYAEDGSFYLDLSGSGSVHASIYQDFTTVPSATYQVSFYIGASNQQTPAATINLQLSEGANTLLNTTLTPLPPATNINWELETFQFVANATSTRLLFHDTSSADDNVSFVDNVVVTAVPEPSTWLLIALGGLLVAILKAFRGLPASRSAVNGVEKTWPFRREN
jgi:hypothetical protein